MTVTGRAPDGSYCAAVVGNATWAIGAAAPAGALASADVTSSGGVIPATVVWPAAAPGAYDVLLLTGSCGATGATIVAAFDAGPAAGFDVGAFSDPIPLLSRGAFAAVRRAAGAGGGVAAGRAEAVGATGSLRRVRTEPGSAVAGGCGAWPGPIERRLDPRVRGDD